MKGGAGARLGDLLKGGLGGLGAVQAPIRFAARRTLPMPGFLPAFLAEHTRDRLDVI